MQVLTGRGVPKQIEAILKDKVEQECFMCLGEFDDNDYMPMMMCMNQHSCCGPCIQELLKNDGGKQVTCPHCNAPIMKKTVTKNRLLLTIFEIVKTYKKYVIDLEDELESLKKLSSIGMKNSLLSKNPKMVNSFISGLEIPNKIARDSTIFSDYPTSKSWVGSSEKRRENLLAYAQREKIEQLRKIAKSDLPFDQVTKIRSGYGSIKKIQCMQYFTNLRQLMLYNNQIKSIQGLTNNLKLNILSLAYNKIEKIENIGHLKELKRFSIQCNKLRKSSAQFMLLYDWKNLESLTISFHELNKEDNDQCFMLLFGTKSSSQWQGLKNLYIYNSKNVGQMGKAIVKEYASRKKTPLQVYWS